MFEIPRWKITRADALVKEFSAIANAFLASQPYSLGLFEDATHLHLVGEVRAIPPTETSLVLGDAIHNLRASLDVLANDAVCVQTGSAEREASFPMAKLAPRRAPWLRAQNDPHVRLREGLAASKNSVRRHGEKRLS